jgi:two-component system response regulator MprA
VSVVSVIRQSRLNGAATAHDRLTAFTGTFWWVVGLSAVPLLAVIFLPGKASASAEETGISVAAWSVRSRPGSRAIGLGPGPPQRRPNAGLRFIGDHGRQKHRLEGGWAGVRIMIADDDVAIRESLERVLQVEGYETSTVANGLAVLNGFGGDGGDTLDLLILDVMMPRLGGLETCRRLRAAGRDLPVLMLTARDQVTDRVAGLDAGADDYLPKPFAIEELLARVRALLRRRTPPDEESQILSFADVRLDPDRFEAWRGGRPLRLTRTEFSLLQVLVRNATRVLTRDVLFEAIWGYDMSATANNLQVYVSYLRRKMEAGGEPRLIYTLRGLGYTLRETPP